MSFFHPLRLGRRIRVVRRDDREDGRKEPAGRRIAHEAWREGIPRVEWEYQEFREADELAALRRAPADEPPRRVRVILGEPGAGKSTLLGEWFQRWATTPETPRLGTPVPVFVRLAALNGRESLPGGEALADLLWDLCCETPGSQLPSAVCATVYQTRRGRLFHPVWLLDGLDEFADARLAGVLMSRLASLPGTVAVSCRTAVFQQRHHDDTRFVRDELEILPLTAPERLAFLTGTLGDEARARDLAGRIAANTQLAQLAGNALMLDLIAHVSAEVALPATRAAFYAAAVRRLWERRCPDAPKTLATHCNRLLTALAGKMQLDRLDLPEERFLELAEETAGSRADALVEAVYASGLVHRGARLATVQFRHLTFQEYYLAKELGTAPVSDTLRTRWTDPRYDETLALLLAMRCDDGHAAEADAALLALIEWGLDTYACSPEELFALGRSPMRTALHLIKRAGLADISKFVRTWSFLHHIMEKSPLISRACASDPQTPLELLTKLAKSNDRSVRLAAAGNPATPHTSIESLIEDSDELVSVTAKKAVEPYSILYKQNTDFKTRLIAAGSSTTPADCLLTLATDQSSDIRRLVAENKSAPIMALSILIYDENDDVRNAAMNNKTLSPHDINNYQDAILAWKQTSLAQNYNSSPSILEECANSRYQWIQEAAARNPSTPPETLAVLADSPITAIREGTALNPATPITSLIALSEDRSARIREAICKNSSSTPEILFKLSNDIAPSVRAAAARNPNTPAVLLEQLARDFPNSREFIAMNPSTPEHILTGLAQSKDISILRSLARNPSVHPAVLGFLAHNSKAEICWIASRNPTTFLECLARFD